MRNHSLELTLLLLLLLLLYREVVVRIESTVGVEGMVNLQTTVILLAKEYAMNT